MYNYLFSIPLLFPGEVMMVLYAGQYCCTQSTGYFLVNDLMTGRGIISGQVHG
ncbi:hypothetical protein D3C80_1833550 [compost metagenome]